MFLRWSAIRGMTFKSKGSVAEGLESQERKRAPEQLQYRARFVLASPSLDLAPSSQAVLSFTGRILRRTLELNIKPLDFQPFVPIMKPLHVN